MINSQRSAPLSDGAIAGEPDLGGAGNAALAGGIGFVHNLPLIGDAAITAGRRANDQLNGRKTSWQQANDEAHQTINSAQSQHPITSTIGGIGGAVDTGVIGGGIAKAAGIGDALALQRGQTALNAARLAATGAAAGGAQAGGEQVAGGHWDQVAPATASGAVMGGVTAPVVGGAGRVALAGVRRFAPLGAQTALALSKAFGENASDLQAVWNQHIVETGRAPSLAEMTNYKQQGIIRGFAKDSTTIADALNQRAEQAGLDRSASVQAGIRPVQPTAPMNGQTALPPQGGGGFSPEEIANATTAQADTDYAAARQHSFTIPTDESADWDGISPADHVASQIVPLAGLGRVDRVRIVNGLQDGSLSGQDAQLLRSKLNAAQGTGSSYSPAIASAQEDLNDLLASPGNEAAHAALSQANARYAAGAQRQAGALHGAGILSSQTPEDFAAIASSKANANPNFAAGVQSGARVKMADVAGTPQGATSLAQRFATDDSLYQKVSGIYGPGTADALRRMGQAEAGSANAMAPYRSAPSPDSDTTLKDAGQIAAAIATHGIGWKAYHAAKVFTGLSMPKGVQNKVAEYLSKPDMAQAGINLLAKAGASAARLRQITLTAAGASGILGGDAASNTISEQESPQ